MKEKHKEYKQSCMFVRNEKINERHENSFNDEFFAIVRKLIHNQKINLEKAAKNTGS